MSLFSKIRPKFKSSQSKKTSFDGWLKCPSCGELVHSDELKASLSCCPKCNHHYPMSAKARINLLIDAGTFEELYPEIVSSDPLKFSDSKKYSDRLKAAQKKTGKNSAVTIGMGEIEGHKVALGVMDFGFMGGSMGSVVGEKITLLIEEAIAQKRPVIIVSASGGARMQESALSLMQMAKTSAALARLSEHKLPFISVPTNPTTGGVTASFATLGDLIIAEPKALIAFAGPRVIEQTVGHKLPEGAQRSEFLLEKGLIDKITPRAELKQTLAQALRLLVG